MAKRPHLPRREEPPHPNRMIPHLAPGEYTEGFIRILSCSVLETKTEQFQFAGSPRYIHRGLSVRGSHVESAVDFSITCTVPGMFASDRQNRAVRSRFSAL